MASSGSFTLQYRFKESWQTTWQLADDDRQHSQAPQTSVLPYIDQSLYIMGTTQLAQDKGIRAEFKQQRLHVDAQFEKVDARFDEVNARFEKVDVRFDEVNARFEKVDARFDKVEMRLDRMDAKFEGMEMRFDDVAKEFGHLRQEFEHRFQNLEARMINSKAFRPGARIEPIGISLRGNFYPTPEPFPKTVRLFWRLRLPEERTTLIQLVYFYGIDTSDWVTWDEDSQDDSESGLDEENSSEAPWKIKQAVNLHPERAMEAVADELGLDYERIHETMSKAALYAPAPAPSKRKQSPTADGDRATKQQRELLPEQLPIPKLTLQELLDNDKPPEKSQSSRAQTEIRWDYTKSFGTLETHRPIRRSGASPGPDSEKQADGSRKASSKHSDGSADLVKKSAESKSKASSKRSEGSTIPISSEDRRAFENRANR